MIQRPKNLSLRLVCLFIALVMVGAWAFWVKDSIAAETAEVILYAHPNYTGRAFPIHGSFGNLRDYNFGNQVSSIRIRGGVHVHLYGNPNFDNYLTTITSSNPFLGNIGWWINDATVSVLYRYAVPKLVAPAIGSNGKVNVPVNESITFKVDPNVPIVPGRQIKRFEWQQTREGVAPDPNQWKITTGESQRFQFDDVGFFRIFARILDNTNTPWNPTEVLSEPNQSQKSQSQRECADP